MGQKGGWGGTREKQATESPSSLHTPKARETTTLSLVPHYVKSKQTHMCGVVHAFPHSQPVGWCEAQDERLLPWLTRLPLVPTGQRCVALGLCCPRE